jgi:hypothetical protein
MAVTPFISIRKAIQGSETAVVVGRPHFSVGVIAPEARMMRKPEIQIGNSNSEWSNKFKLRRRL